jgi:hypothetical protein
MKEAIIIIAQIINRGEALKNLDILFIAIFIQNNNNSMIHILYL